MPIIERYDDPGSWHHVMNRALGHRAFFETPRDHEWFYDWLERVVRRGWIDVHALCLMSTHFHMLVCSPMRCLSAALRDLQSEYVREFNCLRDRDGPLVRGRFRSKLVDSLAYRRMLVNYIDSNPIRAGLAQRIGEYPHGSAIHYLGRSNPLWLKRTWVDSEVFQERQPGDDDAAAYLRAFGGDFGDEALSLLEHRLRAPIARIDPLDRLLLAPIARHLEWFEERARIADGVAPFVPVATPEKVRAVVAALARERGSWMVRQGSRDLDGWRIVEHGLLRDVAGAQLCDIARWTRSSKDSARRASLRHRRLIESDPLYRERCGQASRRIVGGIESMARFARRS